MKLPILKLKSKNLKLKSLLILLFVFSILGFIFTKVYAQSVVRTITVVPPSVQVTLNAGGTSQGQLEVINQSTAPLTFKMDVRDYIVVGNVGTPNFLPSGTLNSKYSAASWIAVNPSTFTIKPGQKQDINYYIQVPINASPCGHYAGIVYTPVATGGTGTGITVETQLGTLFYITVNGKCTEKAAVTKFLAPGFQEYGPVNILTEIANSGDIHIKPQGTITLTGLFANKSYDLVSQNIFPQTVRDFQNSVGQGFMVGQYKAVLLASYGLNNNLPLTATVYFWVFPWRLTLVIVLIIVALILAMLYLRKRKKSGPKATEEVTSQTDVEAKKPVETTKAEEIK